ncbi:MAG: LysE family translocator [Propionibacteriaceae bacterium]|nr:LysE family translocator [Propionibacteriaceae bacterium]
MESLALGLTMGLAAGLSPGPLLVLVIVQTLRSGLRAGVMTALAPLASDAIVVAVTLLLLSWLPGWVLPAIGVVGGGYVIWIAWETWRAAPQSIGANGTESLRSGAALRRALVVNLASPHPWLTWATVLGPLVLALAKDGLGLAGLFVAGFYLMLVGSKVVLALVVARGRRIATGGAYLWVMRVSAALLVVLAAFLIWDSITKLAG